MMECETLSKRPRIEIEQEAAVESGVGANLDEESVERGLIYTITKYCCNSLTLCKRLSEELYLSVLDGVVTLALLLFDKEELYDMGCSRMLADQQKYFWGELEPFADRGDSLYDVCKWIVSKSIDRDQYSLLNEFTVAHMLMIYKSCTYRKDLLIYDEDGDSISIKSPFDDDIEKAIKKAKNHPRLKAEDYSLLLMEIYEDDCVKCQEFLAGKAVECVDVNALYSLEANALQDVVKPNMYPSAYEELDWFIKFDLMMLISIKKMEVRNYSRRGCSIYTLLFNDAVEEGEFSGVDRISRPSDLVSELIQIAELRRKAEGSRFITRDHFVWAFEQRGWGLRSAFKDELASRSAAEDHPPYHIYAIMLRLAIAESALPDVPHLAFAVVFDNLGFSIEEEGEVKELKNCFNRFKPAFMGCVRKPKDQSMVSDGGGGADAGTVGGAWCYGNVSIKDFKEHLFVKKKKKKKGTP